MNKITSALLFATIFIILPNFSWSARIYYKKCEQDGFTCVKTSNNKLQITYTCGKDQDITIYIGQMSTPSNIESLTIQKCQTLTLSTQCIDRSYLYMQLLNITNIVNLKFISTKRPNLPPVVILQNITNIETIPPFTFAQSEKEGTCYAYPRNFHSISLKNVFIDIWQSNALEGLSNFGNFSLENVSINRIQPMGIHLNMAKNGSFIVQNSRIDILEPLAFQIECESVKFYSNKFFDVQPNSISIASEIFHFFYNDVNNIHGHAISVLVQYCFIISNKFQYMKSNALSNIVPGILGTKTKVNIGKMKFAYSFNKNVINYIEAGSLHPDVVSYDNIDSSLVINKNYLYCTCENLGWIVSDIGHGSNTQVLDNFYQILLDEENENVCSHSCDLPVRSTMKKLIVNGKCNNVTLDNICLLRMWTTTSYDMFTISSTETYYNSSVSQNSVNILEIMLLLTTIIVLFV